MKQKILKIQVGQAYDSETKKNLPVYATAWQGKDGNYILTQKVFPLVVETKQEEKQTKVEA